MPLGVDPEAVIGDPVPSVTALIQGLQVTQDICVGDQVSLATAQDDRGTLPVEQLVDQNTHTFVTTNPTAWFSALEVGPQGFSRPGHRAHRKVIDKGRRRPRTQTWLFLLFDPGERARWLMVSFSHRRDLLRDNGRDNQRRSMPRQLRSKLDSN